MIYEVIKEIKNDCANNQMRDVFFEEAEIADPDVWVRTKMPKADSIEKEEIPGGFRYHVDDHGIPVVFTLTGVD